MRGWRERETYADFAAARERADEQQSGDVRDADEQEKSDGPEQREQRLAQRANDLLAHGHDRDTDVLVRRGIRCRERVGDRCELTASSFDRRAVLQSSHQLQHRGLSRLVFRRQRER